MIPDGKIPDGKMYVATEGASSLTTITPASSVVV